MGLHTPTWKGAENGEVSLELPGPMARAVAFGPESAPFQVNPPLGGVVKYPSYTRPSLSLSEYISIKQLAQAVPCTRSHLALVTTGAARL